MEIIDFGIGNYEDILKLQERLFEKLVTAKKEKRKEEEYLLSGEHRPVVTLGRKAEKENLLLTDEDFTAKGIKVFQTGRGGDVTYHGPGQLILYPIIDLEQYNLGVKDFVFLMEEAVIQVLEKYGLKGERIEGATGVWIDKGRVEERKICAIGIKCRRFCTMHGLALNVNTDLSGFSYINPCGFKGKGVTSMKKELKGSEKSGNLSMENVKQNLVKKFTHLLELRIRVQGNS